MTNRTKSLDANGRGPKVYELQLTGKEVYDLVQQLEKKAIETTSYFDLRVCVFLAERVRHEAQGSGWGHDIDPEAVRVYRPEGLPAGIG